MLNIFHIVSNRQWGGAEQYAFDLLYALNADGYYTEAVCHKREAIVKKFRSLEIPVSTLPLKNIITDTASHKRFGRMLKRGNCIVHTHTFRDAYMAIKAKHRSGNPNVRIIYTIHDIDRPKINFMSRKFYREIDRYVFVSQFAYDAYMRHSKQVIDESRAVVIRDSVLPLPEGMTPTMGTDLRQMLDVQPGQALIMFHGRICPEKGIDVALKALTQIDKESYRMAIVGEGEPKYVAQLKAFIVANQLLKNVTFLGFSDRVLSLIEQCDIGLVPSVSPEALGIANLEYMMQGKPVITTNNGAQHEYITNGKNGLLVSPNNLYSTASAIKSLIDDPEARLRIGKQAQQDYNERLSYDIFYQKMKTLYESLF